MLASSGRRSLVITPWESGSGGIEFGREDRHHSWWCLLFGIQHMGPVATTGAVEGAPGSTC